MRLLVQEPRAKRLTPKEEADKIESLKLAIETGDKPEEARIRQLLVDKNRPLVIHLYKRYSGATDFSSEDLIQSGYVGLAEAALRFDPFLGFKFSTFAYDWIFKGFMAYVRDEHLLIRVPRHLWEMERQITSEKISHDDLTESQKHHLDMARRQFGLRKAMTLDEGDDVFKIVIDESEGAGELVERKLEIERMTAAIEDLPVEHHREVMRLRHGLDGKGKRTFREVGHELGISHEHARKIEAKAFEALQFRMGVRTA